MSHMTMTFLPGSTEVDNAYSKTQPEKILDFSEDVSEGDKRRPSWAAWRNSRNHQEIVKYP